MKYKDLTDSFLGESVFGFLIIIIGGFITYYWQHPGWSALGGALIGAGLGLMGTGFFQYRQKNFFLDALSLFNADFESIRTPPEGAHQYRYYYHQTSINGRRAWIESVCNWNMVANGKFLTCIIAVNDPEGVLREYECIMMFKKGRAIITQTSLDPASGEATSVAIMHAPVARADYVGFQSHMTWDGEASISPCLLTTSRRDLSNPDVIRELEQNWSERTSDVRVHVPEDRVIPPFEKAA